MRIHDNEDRNTKDWAMLQTNEGKRKLMLEFLHKARLHSMTSSGQDILLKNASSSQVPGYVQLQVVLFPLFYHVVLFPLIFTMFTMSLSLGPTQF